MHASEYFYEYETTKYFRFDMGQYQCQASNRLGIGRSPPLALNVFCK